MRSVRQPTRLSLNHSVAIATPTTDWGASYLGYAARKSSLEVYLCIITSKIDVHRTIGEPDVRFGNMLLEQFGGANGELAAAMQHTIQGWNCVDDLGRA